MTVIRLTSDIARTPRVMQIEGMFGMDADKRSTTEIPLTLPDLSERDWNVGLIVGPSGAGKTTVARHLFTQQMTALDDMTWEADRAVVDAFPAEVKVQDITGLLSSVGFASPPSWLRPFGALSNGEQFRVSIARLLAEQPDLAVVDEFTSVVDRTVAQIGSHAIAKTVRKRAQRFVAVTCHYDVEDWLQPDWVYQPHVGEFAWRLVQPRPTLTLNIERGSTAAWRAFRRHHYLTESLPNNGKTFVGYIDDQPVAFSCVVPFPHPRVRDTWRMARTVVVPDFQGVGVMRQFTDVIAGGFKAWGRSVISTSGHPALIRSRMANPAWMMTSAPRRTPRQGKSSTMRTKAVASNRLVASFRYVGGPVPSMLSLIEERR